MSRSTASRTRTVALLAAVLLWLTAPAVLADKADEQKKLNAVVSHIQSLQKGLKKLSRQHDQQSASLRKIEVKAGKLRKQIAGTDRQLKTLKQELTRLNQQQRQLQQQRDQQADIMGEHISAAYRLGKEEQIKLLLNEEDPARFSRLLKYHDYFLAARAEKVNEYLATLEQLSDVETSINDNEQALLDNKAQLNQQQDALKTQRSSRKTELAKLNKQISSEQQKLNKLVAERKALEQIIQRLDEAITDLAVPTTAQPFTARKGKMAWPTKGKLRHRFGTRRKADIRWNGWLMNAQAGTDVKAIHNGHVVFSDYLRGHGLLLIIDHGNGYMSLYAHNQVLLKEAGDWVQGGDTIAKVGDSGGLEQSALYFEIRRNGKPQNPAKWLKRRG